MITSLMKQIKTSKSSQCKNDSPKAQDTATVVPANKRYPLLECAYSTKISGMWNIKHDINSPKLYELLTKT